MILKDEDTRSLGNSPSSWDEKEVVESEEEIIPCEGDLLLDIASSCNCYSTRLVKKLSFPSKPHLKSYKHEWINDDDGIVVKEKV